MPFICKCQKNKVNDKACENIYLKYILKYIYTYVKYIYIYLKNIYICVWVYVCVCVCVYIYSEAYPIKLLHILL